MWQTDKMRNAHAVRCWVRALSGLAGGYQCFGGIYCLHLQGAKTVDAARSCQMIIVTDQPTQCYKLKTTMQNCKKIQHFIMNKFTTFNLLKPSGNFTYHQV
jgi:hypothetical protein